MNYENKKISEIAKVLSSRIEQVHNKSDIMKSVELKALYAEIPLLPIEQRATYGKELNMLKKSLMDLVNNYTEQSERLDPIDVTAPFDANVGPAKPSLLPSENGSQHPLMTELYAVLDIFYRMGFNAVESREIDDDYHMFESLNFPEDHPARDDYDTFTTTDGFIAPAHTSTMQNRMLQKYKSNLDNEQPVAVVIPGRVFRNEDLDARHEHTFYQLEGVYVDKGIHAGHLIAVLQTFFETYYEKKMEVKTQPFYFPFTEPSFEFAIACPFCDKTGCSICGEGWLEMLGCGMIHPNVLKMAGIDPEIYTGFAWGGGIERLAMIKHNIEDIRYFESAKLDFLRQFA